MQQLQQEKIKLASISFNEAERKQKSSKPWITYRDELIIVWIPDVGVNPIKYTMKLVKMRGNDRVSRYFL